MQVPSVGAFVRVLLLIQLTGQHTLTYGLWLAIHPTDLQSTFAAWWEPNYQDLRLTGWLGNAVQPWGLLGAPVVAVVRDPNNTPYCESSSDETLSRVLTEEWNHDLVLGALHES